MEIGTVLFSNFFENKKEIINLIKNWKREPSQFPFFPSPILKNCQNHPIHVIIVFT